MKLLMLCITLMTASAAANPTTPVTFGDDIFYNANTSCYTAEYDIVDIHLPVHFISENKVFLVQADTKNKKYKGTFLLHFNITNAVFQNGTARKLIENGKCITSDAKRVYFGTTEGIYTYNYRSDAVEKYGSIMADIRDIEKDKEKDLIYIVTEDNKLYLVTEQGNKMVEHDTIRDVQEIATDAKSNLYFYEKHEDPEKHLQFFEKFRKPKVLVGNSVVNITGLPDKYTNLKLVNVWKDDSIILVVNNVVYNIHSNGTSIDSRYAFLDLPTAYSLEIGLIQLYGLHTQLYCYMVDLSGLFLGVGKALGEAIRLFFSQFTE